jgi:hypothetical protein
MDMERLIHFYFHFGINFLLFSGDWKDLEFKDYNYGAQGQPIAKGYVQPLMEVYL